MPFHLIDTLKDKAGQMAYNTLFYDWSLRDAVPDRLVVRPVDPWPGDAQKAKDLLHAAGVEERTGPTWHNEWWAPENADQIWQSHMHSFVWLRDLRALDGAIAREQGRLMIESWIEHYPSWNAQSWRADLIAQRLSMWICHYEFFCAHANEDFQDNLLASIVKQAKHLSNTLGAPTGLNKLNAIKGLLYSGIALEGHERWIEQALEALENATHKQILSDGGHTSRSPETMLDALEIMVDIRSALKAGAYPVPDFLTDAIVNMSSALRTLRYRDRKLGLFHGTQEGDITAIDSILAQAGTHTKTKKSLPDTGYERLELGRSLLLMDTGAAPHNPYDKRSHASALAFEFCYGKERLFVSCGSHPTSAEWQDALRSTAAHNTACLDMRNSCEIRKDGHFGRKVTNTTIHREETKDAALLIASHNGYVPLNGITHTRKLYISDEGHDLRGEDDFTCAFELIKPVETSLRFHLHPNVQASFIKEDEEILLRMPGGIGWRFKRSAGVLAIEDSLYLGEGYTPRKTKQIAIYGQMSEDEACVKWSLKREG
ncbi:MAG: heparinase II/III family protein [Alphaproteobacteria bacterium]